VYQGPIVTLQQVLDNREIRAHRQREWVRAHSLPIVSFTINMPGNVKLNQISKVGFEAGSAEIERLCIQSGSDSLISEKFISDCGYESISAVSGISAENLKRLMIRLEDTHPLGRLFDIDIFDVQGEALSRDRLGQSRRRCFLCGKDAKICSRNRVHPLPAIIDKMSEIINEYNKLCTLAS